MTNTKRTKKALFMSIISLMICFSMLLGTTFAWFTDSAASKGNVIKSGTLKVDLLMWNDETKKYESIENGNAIFAEADEAKDSTATLWEPGKTQVVYLAIKNAGSLDLKYSVALNVTNTKANEANGKKLTDVLQYTITPNAQDGTGVDAWDGTNAKSVAAGTQKVADSVTLESKATHYFALSVHMLETASDDYQDLTVTFDLTVLATQLASESDSFGKDYDKDSLFPGTSAPSLLGDKAIILVTEGNTPATVVLPAELVSAIDDGTVTEVRIDSSLPNVTDKDGNVSVVYGTFEIVDQNGDVIDLSDNTTAIAVKLYVGTAYAGKYATVAHDGALIANAIVDEDGYVLYKTTHFCQISIALADEPPQAGMDSVKKEDAENLEKLVNVLVGNHYYTVSQGMANSWKTISNEEQIVADVYVPEDLIAYAMMYNNGDITANTGVHSTLTLKNDLDYTRYNWVPIGRFFTNIHGENHTISNINDSFLGCVYDCQVKDLTLENVTAAGSAAGVLGKELAGDIFVTNVTIAGENTVTYVKDNATNWPEQGTGVGAICGVSLIGCAGQGNLDVTVTGTITVKYNGICFGNNTNLKNIGVSNEFGLNIYTENTGVNVTVEEGGSIVTEGIGHLYDIKIAEGFYQDKLNENYFAVYSAEGLTSFAKDVNSGNKYKGNTITLMADIDLGNMAWTPIGVDGFNGTFDGNGHTVSNYSVTAQNNAGLFGYLLNGGNIKNLTVKNAVISANDYAGAILGRGYTDVVNCHAENVKVTVTPYYVEADGVYDGGAKAGAVVGQLLEGSGNTVQNCTAKNVEIIGYRDLGGVLGMAHDNNSVSGCSAENVTIQYVTVDGVYYDGKTPNQNAGAIVGRINSSATVDFTAETNANFTLVMVISTESALKDALKTGATVIDAQGANVGAFNYVLSEKNVPAGTTVTIKNAVVEGRSYGNGVDGTVIFENCTFTNTDAYSIHFDSGSGNVVFNNCKLDGWCSFGSAIKSVKMNGCTFTGNGTYAMIRFYQDVMLTDCTFDCSNAIDGDEAPEGIDMVKGYVATVINCTNVNGAMADLFEEADINGTDGEVMIIS